MTGELVYNKANGSHERGFDPASEIHFELLDKDSSVVHSGVIPLSWDAHPEIVTWNGRIFTLFAEQQRENEWAAYRETPGWDADTDSWVAYYSNGTTTFLSRTLST